MAGGFSTEWEQGVLETAVGRSPEVERFIALCKAEPKKSENGKQLNEKVEVTYTGYARIGKKGTLGWNAATAEETSKITNKEAIAFGRWTAGEEPSVTWFAILEKKLASETGKVVGFGKLASPVAIGAGNPEASFAAGELEVTLT